MHSSVFFKLFPPPRFMVMKYAGLQISDDAIRTIEFSGTGHALTVAKSGEQSLPLGVVDEGDIKDPEKFKTILSEFQTTHGLSYAKVAIPEEKAYLFQTEVPSEDLATIAQNIEFKLEENVPLSAADAIFYFDLMPIPPEGGPLKASVSVVPRTYIQQVISMLRAAKIEPVSFETVPKAVARSVVPDHADGASLIIYTMNHKTGIYVVCGQVVCFASTFSWSLSDMSNKDISGLVAEINRVYTFWTSNAQNSQAIQTIILVGHDAPVLADSLRTEVAQAGLSVSVANIWCNAFAIDKYVPPITFEQSLNFAAAAGLAMEA